MLERVSSQDWACDARSDKVAVPSAISERSNQFTQPETKEVCELCARIDWAIGDERTIG